MEVSTTIAEHNGDPGQKIIDITRLTLFQSNYQKIWHFFKDIFDENDTISKQTACPLAFES